MKIIVGLGNPGRKYEHTRHNAGFLAIDEIARGLRFDLSQTKYDALIGRGKVGGEDVLLVKPQTYMNESGRSAAAAVRYTNAGISDLIVVHDELDLPLGDVRVKVGGGHGGHNGLRSLIEHLGSAEFLRVRVGVGRPPAGRDAADYVLSPFLAGEQQEVAGSISRAAEAVRTILAHGPVKAMNAFNKK
ncbi:MAG: aminoacyl-tRNA hydrolase [Nitrospiraceae bacterium]|nr:aminoacyl-tRNA hydrolase [Nitrospiraceae bacterium]